MDVIIIRVIAPLLRGLEPGEYAIDDPRLKGRGIHWATEGLVEVVTSELVQEDKKPAPKKKAASS